MLSVTTLMLRCRKVRVHVSPFEKQEFISSSFTLSLCVAPPPPHPNIGQSEKSGGNLLPKKQTIVLKTQILAKFMVNIEILSTHNVLCRKFHLPICLKIASCCAAYLTLDDVRRCYRVSMVELWSVPGSQR